MLCLTRKVGQSIVIGEETWITVLKIESNQIQLGIDAPKDISVNREEIHEKIQISRGNRLSDTVDQVMEKVRSLF